MKIQRMSLQNLVLDGQEISDICDIFIALNNNLTAKLLDKLLNLYQKGALQLWLRHHDGEKLAVKLDEITLSGSKVEDLYEICDCLLENIFKLLSDKYIYSFDKVSDAYDKYSGGDGFKICNIFDALNEALVLDGETINTVEELQEHPSTDLLELHQKGTLQLWLRYHDGEDVADKLDGLTLTGDKAEDLYSICQAVGVEGIMLEDIRNALEEEEESEENEGTKEEAIMNSVDQYK